MAASSVSMCPAANFGRSGYNKDDDDSTVNKGRSGYNGPLVDRNGDEDKNGNGGRSGYN